MEDGYQITDQGRAVAYMYDSWARAYDQDVLERFSYRAPRKVIDAVLRNTPANPERILDLATGTGIVLEGLRERFGKATLTGLDLSERMLVECRNKFIGARVHQCDIEAERWPVEDKSIDVVSCAGALGLIGDIGHVLRETRRTLKEDGLAVMSFQIFNVSKGGWGQETLPVQIYKRRSDEMQKIVQDAGFRIVEPIQEFTGFETAHTAELHGVISFTPVG